MQPTIPPRLLEHFTAHAKEAYPKEACGLLVRMRNRAKIIYVRCTNHATSPDEHFVISKEDEELAETYGDIVGVFHSHPDCQTARPSDLDKVMCNAHELPYHIMSFPRVDYQCLMPERMPLIGRPFILGVTDCWGLMIDYHRQYGIELVDPRPYPDSAWWESGKEQRYTEESLIAAGFVMQDKPQIGSMIVMQISAPVANHAGVILPGGMMLHHLYGQLSSRTIYGGMYRDYTWFICRHKDLPPEEDITDVT